MRDVQSTGRGAHVIAGTAGYCFGNLHIPGECTGVGLLYTFFRFFTFVIKLLIYFIIYLLFYLFIADKFSL